jgi:hypothetical protein
MMTSRVRGLVLALLVVPAAACGGDGDGGAGGADGGAAGEDGGADGGVPSTVDPSNQFASASDEWPVPDNGLADGFALTAASTSYRYWTTMDLDGDRRLDIVQTGSTELSQSAWDATGSPYWKVFPGASERWNDSAVEWRVPPNGMSGGFYAADAGGVEWRTFDITGDGKPDLVHTSDPQTGYVWDQAGNAYWKVYANDGEGGFERPAINWAVPDSGTSYGFNATTYDSSYWHWATLDVDGDRKPDLVQTADPATGYVWDEGGDPYWKVFRNSGDGFERQATMWQVPDSGTSGGFYSVVTAGAGMWRVVDLDDDGRADLVQTSDPATGYVWDASGEPYWKVFAGEGEGFAGSPDKWSVPPSGLDDGFFTARAATSYRYWSLVDIDGDRDLDLVQTGDVSHPSRVWDASGEPYWKVYRNQGSGFSADLHRWPIPKSGTAEGFYLVEGSASYTSWALLDADADGHPDLVQTADPANSQVWDASGDPYWKVFRGEE